jgi:Zn-dependent protease with chaperone function
VVSYQVVIAVGLIAVFAALAMMRGAWVLTRRLITTVIGTELTTGSQPRMHAFIAAIAARIGTDPPDDVIAGLQPTFFVTTTEVRVLDRQRPCTGRTLHVSLPLMHLLSEQELAAIIGHELAHFKGRDSVYSRKFQPVYAGLVGALVGVSGHATPAAAFLAFSCGVFRSP